MTKTTRNVAAASTIAALTAGAAWLMQQPQYPDLSSAFLGNGYTQAVGVNSFDSSQPHLWHGQYFRDRPAEGHARYGVPIEASGTAFLSASTLKFAGSGTMVNDLNIPLDGSLVVDLLRNGQRQDQVLYRVQGCAAGPARVCQWAVNFTVGDDGHGATWTVAVKRADQGSSAGGEATPDLNSDRCRRPMIEKWGLPDDYHFSANDNLDVQYVSRPGANAPVGWVCVTPPMPTTTPPPPTPTATTTTPPATPTPGPTSTPPGPQPSPTTGPTPCPSPTLCPPCPPAPSGRYLRVPSSIRQTMDQAPTWAKPWRPEQERAWREKNEWFKAHPGPLYVPTRQVSSDDVGLSVQP